MARFIVLRASTTEGRDHRIAKVPQSLSHDCPILRARQCSVFLLTLSFCLLILLPTIYYLLPTTYYLLPTTYQQPSPDAAAKILRKDNSVGWRADILSIEYE